jgi:glycerol-3-phosphate dehydrogenase
MADFDLAIVGGGINGTGIARDAAGRGLKVLLVEQNDLASGTSSASTKLIHGGLRYLEHGAFRLVREALKEREVLMRIATHLVQPMRFVLPLDSEARQTWLIHLGLFIYDHIGGRISLPRSRAIDLSGHVSGTPLRRRFLSGFEYSDCCVDDARLVILNALDASERGASIRTHTRCVRADRGEGWSLVLNARGRRETVTARALVNASGPWVGRFADAVLHERQPAPVRLVKGSHIVVPRLFDHGYGYIFQNKDGRVVFALPFHGAFTLIGTTDMAFSGEPGGPVPTGDEMTYLCEAVNHYFRTSVSPSDTVWAYAGVRSLYDDGSGRPEDVTRDYVLDLDTGHGDAPLLSIYGGKLTTYRRLAEHVLEKLGDYFVARGPWTAQTPLPGGNIGSVTDYATLLRRRWPFLTNGHAERLALAYGDRASRFLANAISREDLGPWFGDELAAAEVKYLIEQEWAETADDILWRRSKLGLFLSREQKDALARFVDETRASMKS